MHTKDWLRFNKRRVSKKYLKIENWFIKFISILSEQNTISFKIGYWLFGLALLYVWTLNKDKISPLGHQ